MRTAATKKLTLTVLVGGLALALAGTGCKQNGPAQSSGTGGTGGSNSGGSSGSGGSNSGGSSGSGGSSSSGGSSGAGGTSSSGGSSASGGSNSGGSSASGGSNSGGSSASGGSNSGGSSGSGGDSSGGSSGTGGSSSGGSSGTGGSTQAGLNCSSPIAPSNGSAGGVTDFTDYNTNTGKWGSTSGLYGSVYGYPGAKGSKITGTADGTNKDLHLVGSVTAGDYAGGGLSFDVCATVSTFTKIQFTVAGSAPGCDLELQIQTFDQKPAEQGGGCYRDGGTGSCYGFPDAKKIATPSSTAADVVKVLATDFTNWSDSNAKQVIGLQWQFTGTGVDGDAGASCPVDVTITNIKFLP